MFWKNNRQGKILKFLKRLKLKIIMFLQIIFKNWDKKYFAASNLKKK